MSMTRRIAIQGFEGSFHQAAAHHYFNNDVHVITCSTFKDVIKAASSKKESEGAVMAIENSLAGSILPNYNLLQKSNLVITGEIFLHIRQHLMVNKGVQLKQITEVHSHPMALQQCLAFLDKHNWKLVESEDTALSAKHIHQKKSKHIAAIAGKMAADLYNLDIVAPNIHTMKPNYTRFLVLERPENVTTIADANKATIQFHTNHTKGSLAKVLGRIADHNINLSKLQSMPIPGTEWKYSFHADMEFSTRKDFDQAIRSIRPLTEDIRVYGIYRKGETI